ncbi:MAG: 1-phosphofructokinase [candidate division NC10 bacterium]|nr:1-phosphofructokinase [candidate division NC10 bacterium]
MSHGGTTFPEFRVPESPVITVTPNPALDRTLRVDELSFGGIARVQGVQEDPGGKGINVSRVLRQFGCSTAALGFLGGSAGRSLMDAMAKLAIDADFIAVPGETRINLTLTDGEHEIKVNEPGPSVPPHAVDALIARVRQRARESSAVVLAGSLPPGVPVAFYAELIRIIQDEGAKPVLDTAGPPLAHGGAARPYLIKPNRREAEALLGIPLDTDDAIREAVRRLSGYGIPIVALSLGAGGAICACGGMAWRAEVPPVAVLSTVGSGDAFLACLLLALLGGVDPSTALWVGTAAGLASVTLPGSRLCTRAELERMLPLVRVRPL